MRIRSHEVDPVVALMALAVAVLGFVFGLGLWGVAAGMVIFAAAAGSRSVTAWATRRFALPPLGTQERALVARSIGAAATMRRLVSLAPDGPITTRTTDMERQARAALPTIRALALQAFRVRGLAEGIPIDGLEGERRQTLSLLAGDPEERLRMELDSSLRSTEAQLGTGRRLRTLTDELFARTRALTISMEAVAAGLAELQAMSASDQTPHPNVALANLSREIDALRGGLDEAQTFGRRVAAINHVLEV
jgi:hypothetical protein